MIGAGGIYWLVWAKILPKIGVTLVQEIVVDKVDGWERNVFKKDYKKEENNSFEPATQTIS